MAKKAKKKVVRAKMPSKELRCFIIMPFTKAEYKDSSGTEIKLTEGDLEHIFDDLICKAVNEYSKKNKKKVKFVSVHRYDKKRGNFVKGIINDLDNADLVIADLTGLNPNVFYELGIRHTLKVGTIMLTQSLVSLPADLRNYVAFEYKYPQDGVAFAKYYLLFEEELHKHIDEYLEDHKTGEYDNPVRDFIGSRIIFQNEQRIKEVKGNIRLMDLVMREYIINVTALGIRMEYWASEKGDNLCKLQNSIKPFINRLMMLNEEVGVIVFLTGIVMNLDIIESNMLFVKRVVQKAKDTKVALETYFGFRGMDGKMHHVLELYEHYKDSGKKEDCPIYKSFQKFISDWESELESLIS